MSSIKNKIPRPSPDRPFPFPPKGGSIKAGGPHLGKTPLPKPNVPGEIKPGGPHISKTPLPKPSVPGEIKPGGPHWGKTPLPECPDPGSIKPGGPFQTDEGLKPKPGPENFFVRPTDSASISKEAGKPETKVNPALLQGLGANFQ